MNTFGVLSGAFQNEYACLVCWICRRVADGSIYYTVMLTPDVTPKGAFLDLTHDD